MTYSLDLSEYLCEDLIIILCQAGEHVFLVDTVDQPSVRIRCCKNYVGKIQLLMLIRISN